MKRPSFQFYPKDLLSDRNVAIMSNAQLGGYLKLLCYMWQDENCTLPNDEELLQKLSGLNSDELRVVQGCFNLVEPNNNQITHKRLQEERMKQDEWRAKSRKGGLESAKSRLKGGSRVVQPKGNTSSSTSSSIEEINKEKDFSKAHPSFLRLDDLCKTLGLENKVNPKLFLETLFEYQDKVKTVQEVRDCLYWCKDHNKKQVTVLRIRNWFRNAKEFAKNAEIKRQTEFKDQIHTSDSVKTF